MSTGDMRSMTRLERLEGADFGVAFMKSMSRHYWKALTEAEKCVDTAYHDELVSMCEDILDAQLPEIDQMQTWLCQWYDRCGGDPPRLPDPCAVAAGQREDLGSSRGLSGPGSATLQAAVSFRKARTGEQQPVQE